MLLLDFKQLQKEAEKRWIQHVTANIITFQANNNDQKTKTAAAEESSSIKEDLISNSEKLTHSVKGKFGKQIRETIKMEAKKIDQL